MLKKLAFNFFEKKGFPPSSYHPFLPFYTNRFESLSLFLTLKCNYFEKQLRFL
jgi:hypothetical protein